MVDPLKPRTVFQPSIPCSMATAIRARVYNMTTAPTVNGIPYNSGTNIPLMAGLLKPLIREYENSINTAKGIRPALVDLKPYLSEKEYTNLISTYDGLIIQYASTPSITLKLSTEGAKAFKAWCDNYIIKLNLCNRYPGEYVTLKSK